MEALWERIRTWLKINAPRVFDSLQPGAAEEDLLDIEAFLGVTLPDDVRASYRIHNGQFIPDGQYSSGPSLLDTWELLPLARVRDEWRIWKDLLDGGEFRDIRSDPTGPIQDDWWHPRWIPLAHDAGGNNLCSDLAPAPGGELGQIITVWHDDAERDVVAPSFRMWLGQFADALERGEYIYARRYDGLRRKI